MMLQELPPLHSGEEMQGISNLAHLLEGIVIGVAAVVMIVESRRRLRGQGGTYAWPLLLFGAAIFLLGYLLVPHHGLELARTQWHWVFGDPQQRQHLLLSALIALGSGGELLYRSRPTQFRKLAWAWPATTIIAGILFIVHTQHGTSEAVARATAVHRVLGSVLVLAGVMRGVSSVKQASRGAWELAAGTALLAAAILLLVYREPPGAYTPNNSSGHSQHR